MSFIIRGLYRASWFWETHFKRHRCGREAFWVDVSCFAFRRWWLLPRGSLGWSGGGSGFLQSRSCSDNQTQSQKVRMKIIKTSTKIKKTSRTPRYTNKDLLKENQQTSTSSSHLKEKFLFFLFKKHFLDVHKDRNFQDDNVWYHGLFIPRAHWCCRETPEKICCFVTASSTSFGVERVFETNNVSTWQFFLHFAKVIFFWTGLGGFGA